MNRILQAVKEAKLFVNCSGLFSYLTKNIFCRVEDVIEAVAYEEGEGKESASIKAEITAFAFGFFAGHWAHKDIKELLERVVNNKSTEDEDLFAYHFVQLARKFQNAGLLPDDQKAIMTMS